MACPYFVPQSRRDDLLWPHPSRLPLGAGFGGSCGADPSSVPSDEELKQHCNLGYATRCPRLPREREADSVRYAVSLNSQERIVITWVTERDHAPRNMGHVEYDCQGRRFTVAHPDARIQRQLECYLEQYFARRVPSG